jgi:hypothetical protein
MIGIVFIGVGLLITLLSHFTSVKLGGLPGDILIRRGSFRFYFPLTTCVLLSILLTLIFSLFTRK